MFALLLRYAGQRWMSEVLQPRAYDGNTCLIAIAQPVASPSVSSLFLLSLIKSECTTQLECLFAMKLKGESFSSLFVIDCDQCV